MRHNLFPRTPKMPWVRLLPLSHKSCLLLFFLMATGASILAEGSKDFRNYPGYRLFLDTRNPQQFKVYAKPGEYINVGASHLGFSGGYIEVYAPDGTLVQNFSDPSSGVGVIFDDVQEINGPTGGGTMLGPGYIPGVIQVPNDGEGIWTVVFDFPTYMTGNFTNLLNSDPWTRMANQPQIPRVILAWDITISQGAPGNMGGNLLEGRVYSNEYVSIINQNGFKTSPTYYILTKDGFTYEVSFNEADPFRFPISSNSSGFVYENLDRTYMSQYRDSVIRSDDYTSWLPGQVYYYEPQAEDLNGGLLVNNKVFFNLPDPTMPAIGLVTDIYRNNTHVTWLYNPPATFTVTIDSFEVVAFNELNEPCNDGTIEAGIGGNLNFQSSLSGTAVLQLDLNHDGDFADAVDRTILQNIQPGTNTIFWDGKDGTGTPVPATNDFMFNYKIEVRGGEAHIIMEDIENNFKGVTFSWIDTLGTPTPIAFYYDHSQVGGTVSGGGSPGNAMPTLQPFVYINNFGDEKFLDYWMFVPFQGVGQGAVTVDVLTDCTAAPKPDYDSDGVSDDLDIDDDNDGITDQNEYCNPQGGFSCLPGGLDPSKDADADGIPNFLDADDPQVNNPCTDANNDGICDKVAAIYDTDGDNVPDHLDLDSDNDGITDLVEAGHGQPDVNGDGIIDGAPAEFGLNGLYNPLATLPDDSTATENYVRWDWDGDGVPDHDDLDADNDGIHDVVEAGFGNLDADLDGRIDVGTPALVTAFGIPFSIAPAQTGVPIPLPFDKDHDFVPDWHDLDSDNDAILDVLEGGNADPDDNGIIGQGIPVVNADGQATQDAGGMPLSTTSAPFDSDNDGVPDFHDLDSDNDGLNDVAEASRPDADNNGVAGTGNLSVTSKGIPVADGFGHIFSGTSLPDDTDNDGVRDFRDLDSDNDGINDVAEINKSDPDNDGITGTGNPVVNADGQATVSGTGDPLTPTSTPRNTDNDANPDFRDLDTDGDGISDVIEGGNPDPDNDNVIGTGTPVVNIFGQAVEDQNGLPLSTTSAPTNTDGGVNPDFRDLDSDDDGISDSDECPDDAPCANGDGDAFPDFQDIDRDNDGINDADECENGTPCPDTDNDGILDVDDLDTDGDGIPDADECPGGAPCPDSDNDGTPDWRDFDCNPLTPVPKIASVTGAGTYCNGDLAKITIRYDTAGYTGAVTYQVTGPNNFDTTATPIPPGPFSFEIAGISQANAGMYDILLLNGEGCPGDSTTVSIILVNMANQPVFTTPDTALCAGEEIVLTASGVGSNLATYQWYFSDSTGVQLLATTNDSVLVISNADPTNSGNYWVEAAIGSCVAPPSDTLAISVSDEANVLVALSVIDANLCVGQSIEIIGSTVMVNGATYEWYFDDGTGPQFIASTDTAYLLIPNADLTHSGTYTARAKIGSCLSPPSNPVEVVVSNMLDETPFLQVLDNNLCAGQTLQMQTFDQTGMATAFDWYFNDGSGPVLIATTTLPMYSMDNFAEANEGFYSVVMRIDGCASNPSNQINVTVADIS
ncbi:MAG: hypothetical protein D6714_08870, partial [Bacteroidetes bacterium]